MAFINSGPYEGLEIRGGINYVVGIICSPIVEVGSTELPAFRGVGHCVLKKGFTRTFPRNQDVTVKLKSELIFIKF